MNIVWLQRNFRLFPHQLHIVVGYCRNNTRLTDGGHANHAPKGAWLDGSTFTWYTLCRQNPLQLKNSTKHVHIMWNSSKDPWFLLIFLIEMPRCPDLTRIACRLVLSTLHLEWSQAKMTLIELKPRFGRVSIWRDWVAAWFLSDTPLDVWQRFVFWCLLWPVSSWVVDRCCNSLLLFEGSWVDEWRCCVQASWIYQHKDPGATTVAQ